MRRRLNPFAFPSPYAATFALLIIAILAFQSAISALYLEAVFLPGLPLVSRLAFLSFPLSSLVVFPCLTAYLYLKSPKSRAKRLEPAGKYPEVLDLVRRLSARLRVEAPKVLLKGVPTLEAEVFGNHREAYLELGEGLCRAGERLAEPIIAHELAHLRNGDVTKHCLAEEMVKAFLVTLAFHASLLLSLSPLLSGYFLRFHSSWLRGLYILPLLIVYLLNGQLLRAREFLADARAASLGFGRGLSIALRLLASKPRLIDRLKGYPGPLERVRALAGSELPFEPGLGYGFAVGVLMGFLEEALELDALMAGLGGWAYEVLPGLLSLSTGFALYSLMALPLHFLACLKGLRVELGQLKFLAGFASGLALYNAYACSFVPELAIRGLAHALLVSLFWLTLSAAQLLLLPLLFAGGPSSRRLKLLALTVAPSLPLGAMVLSPEVGLALLACYVAVPLTLVAVKGIGRCPNCGAELRGFNDILICHRCGFKLNRWVLSQG